MLDAKHKGLSLISEGLCMEIIDVDRFEGGIVLTFSDGLTARYTAEVLRQMAEQATPTVLSVQEPED